MLANFKTPKVKNKKHLRFVASLPCVICRRTDVQAAHIRSGNGAGVGMKSGDDCTIPLCITCHRKQHESNERTWWEAYGGIEKATALAKTLYAHTGDSLQALQEIARFR